MDRDHTFTTSRGIISIFLDLLDIVHLTAGAGLIGYLEHNIVLILQCLHLFVNFVISIV